MKLGCNLYKYCRDAPPSSIPSQILPIQCYYLDGVVVVAKVIEKLAFRCFFALFVRKNSEIMGLLLAFNPFKCYLCNRDH